MGVYTKLLTVSSKLHGAEPLPFPSSVFRLPSSALLYFHIPFCSHKCAYCHFYVLPDKEPLKLQLLNGLELEWQWRLPLLQNKTIRSVYFGGGTPYLLGPERIGELIRWIRRDVMLAEDVEITLEANPENVTVETLTAYREAGINRLSIGVQSLDVATLNEIDRRHSAQRAIEAVYCSVEAGITNISIDLMYDLPGQTLESWKATLNQAVQLPITHLSLYNLTLEPHTVFFKKKEEIKKRLPDEATSLNMLNLAVDTLESHGLKRYEISAFARNGLWSRHNVGYWTALPFLGFGPSAFSYWNSHRFRNTANLSRYCKALVAHESPVDFDEELPLEERQRELLAVQLRLLEGVDLSIFQQRHGQLSSALHETLLQLASDGLISHKDGLIALTERGALLYDTVATEMI